MAQYGLDTYMYQLFVVPSQPCHLDDSFAIVNLRLILCVSGLSDLHAANVNTAPSCSRTIRNELMFSARKRLQP
jgi:hypothetical protein